MDLLLYGFVLQAEPLVQLPLTDALLSQPPEYTRVHESTHPLVQAPGRSSAHALCERLSHEVLVPGLAELNQVRLDAVHLLVDLPVVGRLFLQVHLQVPLAVHDL